MPPFIPVRRRPPLPSPPGSPDGADDTSRNRISGALLVALTLVLVAALAVLGATIPDLLRNAFPGGNDAQGIVPGITNAVKSITDAALPVMLAVVPLSIVVGAFSLLVGSRRGVAIIGSALGALLLLLSVNGIAS